VQIEKEFQFMNSRFVVSVPDKNVLPLIKSSGPYTGIPKHFQEKIGLYDYGLKAPNPMLPDITKI
jgi:hypothetical protein